MERNILYYSLGILLLILITGCSTIAGAVHGIGDDVKSGTETMSGWIKPSKQAK
jgi:predicted small secreted protein